jgi:uncharacterized protein
MGRADTALIVFTRKPVPGKVKTRLIGALGADGAAALQRRMLSHALETAHGAGFGAIELHCSPDCDDPFLRDCAARHDVSLHQQQGAGLGERMAAALSQALRRHANAILIGSDVPSLTADDLRFARSAVESGRLVVGPAEDGGYVLIGLAGGWGMEEDIARLFTGMAWGDVGVMAATRRRLDALGASWVELPPRWDVDTPADLPRLTALMGRDGLSF